jgi:hypothetical protein
MSGRQLALVPLLAVALAAPMICAAEPTVVNDVTQLNPIRVERVAKPSNAEEVRELVKSHAGPISIGGGRYSMGGQIASDGVLFLDMRGMDHVLAFSPREKTITVETGISWRKIQEAVDPQGLSVKIMQSYANFTVGGSLSVNVHGRYVGQGPLIGSVKSIKIVLADGSLVAASPTENSDLFYGAIGSYGGLGVIVEATLDLADDVRVERDIRSLPVAEYKKFFFENVRNSPGAVFHNGDLYPPAYDRVMAITWSETDRPATIADHLQPVRPPDWWDHLTLFEVSELPFGKELRAKVIDPVRLRGHPVVWRNYEASYDVGQLEPSSPRPLPKRARARSSAGSSTTRGPKTRRCSRFRSGTSSTAPTSTRGSWSRGVGRAASPSSARSRSSGVSTERCYARPGPRPLSTGVITP